MPDTLTTITKLINSPPGQLAAGGVLAGIVWKFFERVEAVLTDQTKFEIAVWLVGVRARPSTERLAMVLLSTPLALVGRTRGVYFWILGVIWLMGVQFNMWTAHIVLIDNELLPFIRLFAYLILLWFGILELFQMALRTASFIILQLSGKKFVSDIIWWLGSSIVDILGPPLVLSGITAPPDGNLFHKSAQLLMKVPVLGFLGFASLSLLCLYPLSVSILKAARRFDIGFDWFNRKFDIEKKPLQAVGLVAGALVAVVYWVAVIVSRVVG
jgi:hypothetical protein